MAETGVRVLIVEDQRTLADSLRLALGMDPFLRIVATGGTAAEALVLAREQRPDVVLMDHYLPDGTGVEVAVAIREEQPAVAIVMLTGGSSDEVMLAAIEAGVSGYLLKTEPAAAIADAVRRAAAGEMLVPPNMIAALIAHGRERAAQRAARAAQTASLTAREREVLALVAQGLDTRAIAAELHLGLNTVRGYIQSTLEKLDAHSRLEAILRANEAGLLDL